MKYLFVTALTIAACGTKADLVYQPRNPTFGGNSFNGSFYLSTAQIENRHSPQPAQRDAVDDFLSSLERRLLSELSRDITESIFGENAQDAGSFEVDGVTIDFLNTGENINITLTDEDGTTTELVLPTVQPVTGG
mgnify:CR=1 FL=1